MSVVNEYTYIAINIVVLYVCGDAIFGRGDAIFGHGDLHFRPWLGIQYKFTESSGISGCCLSWAGISLWLGCAWILVSFTLAVVL